MGCPELLITFVILSYGLAAVNSHGTLFLQFVRYFNHDGRCADGTLCDPFLFFNSRESYCDPSFLLTADRYIPGGSSFYNYQQPGFYFEKEDIYFVSEFAGMPNPVPFAMNYADNNGIIYITVTVMDRDGNAHDLMDVFSAKLNAFGTDVKSLTMVSAYMGHTLSLNYWFVCHPNFYDSLCNTYCLAQDSAFGGHYTCNLNGEKVCRAGWVGPSTDCKTPHPCSTGVCQNGATCVPVGESYSCQCPADFAGTNCELYRDPCIYRNPCVNGGQCVLDGAKQPRCRCPPQFTGNRCDVDVDECAVGKPCSNGMPCLNTYGGFRCNCTDAKFIGDLCDIDVDECAVGNPCSNGMPCLNTYGGFRCNCTDAKFIGDLCDIDVDECAVGNPCSNDMPCLNTYGGFHCNCTDAQFTGDLCEIDRCNGTVCENNGTCLISPTDDSPECNCTDGFDGKFCEIAIPCYSSPCRNGATCSNNATAVAEFTCTCPPEFYGSLCETARPDYCASGPCRNGGNCTGGVSGFTCTCPPEFYGSLCETARPDYCASRPCRNGGNCTGGVSGFTCACPPGFAGPTCEDRMQTAANVTNLFADAAGESVLPTGAVAGLAAGCAIGFLLLAGAAVFLVLHLVRRGQLPAESAPGDANTEGFPNAAYSNSEAVRTDQVPSVYVEADDAGEVYEAVSAEQENNAYVADG